MDITSFNKKESSRFLFLINKSDHHRDHISSKIMQKAFLSVNRRNYPSKWIGFENLKSENLSPHDLIVMDRFDGKAFEHFRNVQVRIIGPLVIKYCDEDACCNPIADIPMRTWPIYSQCMRGLEVTCSNLSVEKKKLIQNKIELMSGKYYHNLHESTSFLVSDSVLSSKSCVARKYQIPIMAEDWVETCWKQYQYEYRRANEESIVSKHRLPIFYGLNVVVSGLTKTERDQIKQLAESNGGKYHPALKLKPFLPNMILILRKKQGDKYVHAQQHKIPCLRVEWIHDSIKSRYALPFEVYSIDTEEKTPPKIQSAIHNDDKEVKEKTSRTDSSEELSSQVSLIDEDDGNLLMNLRSNSPRITIMFSGFEREVKMKLTEDVKDILKIFVRDHPLLSHEVTHLILENPCGTAKVYAAIVAGVYIMKPKFIFDSLKAGKLLPETEYQWGMDYREDLNRKESCSKRLMVAAIKWKHYLDQTKRKLFEDFKFLFLNQTKSSQTLTSCANILRAGGAKVFLLDDDHQREIASILPQISYALVDSRFARNSIISKQEFIKYIEYFDRNNRLISDTIIYRLIIYGPDARIDELKKKFPLSMNAIRDL